MRIEFVSANRGFVLHVNEYDAMLDEKVVFMAVLLWKQSYPVRMWRLAWRNGGTGSLEFKKNKRGKRSGWRLRGPIERWSD